MTNPTSQLSAATPPRVVQAVYGAYHHFDLARQLQSRGYLHRIYSTWPWARIKREGVPASHVGTYPWIHTLEYALHRYNIHNLWLWDQLSWANVVAFDRWLEKQRRKDPVPWDILVAISGAGLTAGRNLQKNGGTYICDRGSTHIVYGDRLLAEEHKRWGAPEQTNDRRDLDHEVEIYSTADLITVPSHFAAQTYIDAGIASEKLRVIPYGVELSRFQPTGVPPSDTFEVVFAGFVSLRKGIPYLLQAFADFKHPRKRLRCVGGIQSEIKEVLARLPAENVEFVPPVSQPELAAIMSTSHVLVLPSLEEGLALVQAQAMACGCPIIASTNTGGSDLFTDGMEGFIVPIRDPAAIAARLELLAATPSLRDAMSSAALKRVKLLGGWSEYGGRWASLLDSLPRRS